MSALMMMSGVVVLMATGLLLVGLGSRKRVVVNINERLSPFVERVDTLEERELQVPFSQRVIKPFIKRLALSLGNMTPASNTEKLRVKLSEAGNPSGIGTTEFMGLRFLMALALGGFAFLLFTLAQAGAMMALLIPICLMIFGFMLPNIWIDRKIKARKKEIQRALPDAIDLLTISVESGLGFDPALMRVAEKWDNSLSREFARALSEMRIGKTKREALREMGIRVGLDDLNTFISAVIQADTLGVAISQVLRIQSDAMRVKRRQRAEELAHKAPIKMLFPMVFLIFPALYVIILGPAVPRIVDAFK